MAEFIVAIELGSSKITGIAGHKNLDGSITVQAVAQENSAECIRKGVVYNIDKTVQALTSIMKKTEASLKRKVAHVYVGVGGQSIQSVRNTNVREPFCRQRGDTGYDQLTDGRQPQHAVSRQGSSSTPLHRNIRWTISSRARPRRHTMLTAGRQLPQYPLAQGVLPRFEEEFRPGQHLCPRHVSLTAGFGRQRAV